MLAAKAFPHEVGGARLWLNHRGLFINLRIAANHRLIFFFLRQGQGRDHKRVSARQGSLGDRQPALVTSMMWPAWTRPRKSCKRSSDFLLRAVRFAGAVSLAACCWSGRRVPARP